jgi:hypothetical protein
MKKFLFVLIFALIVKGGFGNPIIVFYPDVRISELYFNEYGQWQLEISVSIPQEFNLNQAIDSLWLESNAGEVGIKPFPINSYEFLIVIDQDGVFEPLQIDAGEDHLQLQAYVMMHDEYGNWWYDFTYSDLYIGWSYTNIQTLLPGQSICLHPNDFYYKDNSPTLGFPNDTSDAYGFLKGRLFDMNLNVVTKGDFIIEDRIDNFIFDTVSGYFIEKVFAKNWSYGHVIHSYGGGYYEISIDVIHINMEVDSTVIQDIYLLDTIVGLPETIREISGITIIPAPNPCRDETSFFINIPDDINYTSGMVTLYENSGKKLRSTTFSGQRSFTMQLNTQGLPQGVYIYSLSLDDRSVKSGQLLVVR